MLKDNVTIRLMEAPNGNLYYGLIFKSDIGKDIKMFIPQHEIDIKAAFPDVEVNEDPLMFTISVSDTQYSKYLEDVEKLTAPMDLAYTEVSDAEYLKKFCDKYKKVTVMLKADIPEGAWEGKEIRICCFEHSDKVKETVPYCNVYKLTDNGIDVTPIDRGMNDYMASIYTAMRDCELIAI